MSILHTITQVTPKPNYCLRLIYSDGAAIVVNLRLLIEQGGVFEKLANPQVFAQVELGDRGRYIHWNETIDFCADALRQSECFVHESESLAS